MGSRGRRWLRGGLTTCEVCDGTRMTFTLLRFESPQLGDLARCADCDWQGTVTGDIPTETTTAPDLREALFLCWVNDGTTHVYGGSRRSDGRRPDIGQRWVEPREVAFATLRAVGVNCHDLLAGRTPPPWKAA